MAELWDQFVTWAKRLWQAIYDAITNFLMNG